MDSEEVLFQLGGWEKGYLNHKEIHYNIITFYTVSQISTFEITFATENGRDVRIL